MKIAAPNLQTISYKYFCFGKLASLSAEATSGVRRHNLCALTTSIAVTACPLAIASPLFLH